MPEGLTGDDWSSIRAAYEAGRHAAFAVDGGHRARNPGQQWSTLFDGRGFTTTPDAGGWSWGLELTGWGGLGAERAVAAPPAVTADGQRVAYDWDEQLTEWYVNDQRGLEHGYTVHARPDGLTGELTLALAIRGDLLPEVADAGRAVRFLDSAGGTVLTYSGLSVFDAGGEELPARFEPRGAGLLLTIDENGATYPLTIDPVAQQAYLKASNTGTGDFFGWSVAVSGDTVVVGAIFEDSSATGVDGDQSDNGATDSGAAYVFVRSGTSWSQQAYLKASNTGANDVFGISVAVSGDTVVVGAQNDDSSATGVGGNQSDNSAVNAGAAYVFVRSGTSWSQQAYLKASNTGTGDSFGNSVAVSGDTVVVAASPEDSSATGIDGDQNSNSAFDSGAAYVFVRSGTSWSQQAYLKASNTEATDHFGASVAISGDTVVVGAVIEDSSATGVDGDQSNNDASNSGAVYVFVRSGTSWSQQAYLKASNTGASDQFGGSVAISGDTVVAGANSEDSSATGVDGDQSDNGASDSGAAYVFVRSGTSWSQQAYLKASNTGASDQFGQSLAISDNTVVVGANSEDSGATGVDGDQSSNGASGSGAAYVFLRSGMSWSQRAYLKASNTGAADAFGASVALSGDTVVVAAPFEDSNATGVGGDGSNNSAPDSGSAYVYLVRSELLLTLPDCPDDASPEPGQQIAVQLEMTPDAVTSGYLAFVEYEMAVLEYRGDLSSYTLSPFPLHVSPIIQADDGRLELDGSVGLGDPGTSADALLATLVFDVLAECGTSVPVSFESPPGTFPSELSYAGVPVPTTLVDPAPVTLDDTPPSLVGCPSSFSVPADAPGCAGAVVNFTAPTAIDGCDSSPTVICTPPSGSFFPMGTTPVLCTATDDCGNVSNCGFDVTVTGSNTVAVDVELVGVSVPVSRCVRFVTNGCGADTEIPLSFVDHDALPGTPVRASALIEVPCGTYISLCGKDRQHTTWSTVGLVLSGTIWQATSVMSLEAGDTDDDGDVDIHDITWFIAQFGDVAAAGGCPWDGITRDADFSNNGVIAAEDYSFLVDQWLTTSACACALTWLPGGPLARPALSAEVGSALQAKADLNRDGRVDDRDVELLELRHGLSGELSRRMRASR